MYRCCPETCEAGELTEDDCNALSNVRARGNCDYADNPQICIRPPTFAPSDAPTTPQPTFAPSITPTTSKPTFSPSDAPTTPQPTFAPSDAPTTSKPTFVPSDAPTTSKPTFVPTEGPTTSNPTFAPSKSPIPTPQVTYTTHYKKQCPSNNWVASGRYTFGEALQICTADPKCVAFNFGAKPDPEDESTHGIEATTYFHHNCRSTAYESWHDNLYVKDPKPSTGCQPQDNDACIQNVWGSSYTCASAARWCDSYAKDMYRCRPESCEAGELTEDDCNALPHHGTCDYANNPQICIRPPTFAPSDAPTTSKPTFAPSEAPTTSKPTFAPSDAPTTSKPTSDPSQTPTPSPTPEPTATPPVTYITHYKKQCPSNNWFKSGRYTFGEALQICSADPKCVAFNFGAKPDPDDESTYGIEASTYFHHNCRSTAYESWHDNLYVKDPVPGASAGCQDNDVYIQNAWGSSYTCASAAQWCDGYAKDMYRCCPETCEAGVFTKDDCDAVPRGGTCDYANNPQICTGEGRRILNVRRLLSREE